MLLQSHLCENYHFQPSQSNLSLRLLASICSFIFKPQSFSVFSIHSMSKFSAIHFSFLSDHRFFEQTKKKENHLFFVEMTSVFPVDEIMGS